MSVRLLVALSLCALACGKRQPVAEGPIQVAGGGQRIAALQSLVATGPTAEVCFDIVGTAHSSSYDRITFADGNSTRVAATLLGVNTTTGDRTQLELRGLHTSDGTTCLWSHPGRTPEIRYDSVMLGFDFPVTIRQIHWWSGERIAFP